LPFLAPTVRARRNGQVRGPQQANQAIAVDAFGNIWVGFSGGEGIWKWTGSSWQQMSVPPALAPAPYASVLRAGANGDMWAGST
jgi:hypothetical protein